MVERVTEVLADTVALPAYEEWVELYRRAPAHYDEEMLGFWKESQ